MFLCFFYVTNKIIERDVIQNISQKAPEFIIAPRNVHVDEGANTTLSCHVSGNPPPSVQWSRGRQILKHGTKYKVIIVTSYIVCLIPHELGKELMNLLNTE